MTITETADFRVRGSSEDEARLLRARALFVNSWCKAKGKSIEELSKDEIFIIRQSPGWKNPIIE